MIKEIITDEEILSKPCEPATAEDAAIADNLVETLLASDEAVCLAANQIGETKCIVAYLNEAGKPVVMYNPKISQKLKPYTAVEACLSREEPTGVMRYDWIRVAYDRLQDGKLVPAKKKLEGNSAQAVQHMIDHCEGILV
ncbi:peptide deformylase [Adlercreutzia shanghongiae]|uniref:Peptide deformylase n=1 Tax=Adlercreutzia shanghongiae TaxID=3111773 RepID=A0ABU6IZE4_9ACTN|nr:peptide deformylase [Adlercreutzia sp. R22]MEC4294864.1 peptide deformylase [Adlercreutzia sp. R22]